MKDDKRACFALIAASIINKRRYNSVFDFKNSRYISVSSSNVQSNYLSFFDYNRGGYVSGSANNLYDYPTSSYVTFKHHNNMLSGFDYETGNYVNFTVRGRSITAFDYQTSSFYEYGV